MIVRRIGTTIGGPGLAVSVAASCWLWAAEPVRRTLPLPVEQARLAMKTDPGLRVELAAAEPEVESPVAAAFDEQGRLWVVEMLDYPNGPAKGQSQEGRIKILEDRDNDGRFESARIFADKLLFANGLLHWKGGVIVTAAPHIAYLRDVDGDGSADERKILYEGFATANVQLRVSHPVLGPDNWIYVANGLRGGNIRAAGAPSATPISISGMDFRFDPVTGRHEAVSGMGQFGLTFDDWGNRFVCDNNHHLRHVVLPNRYLRRNPFFAAPTVLHDTSVLSADVPGAGAAVYPLGTKWTTSNLHANRFTAACGVFVYRGSLLPDPYRGAAFTCEPTGNLVHAETLTPAGVTFASRPLKNGVEFLASTDEWFRPVNLTSGPDGAMYVVDMSRAVIEHPEWMPPELKQRPDLNDGKHTGRIWRIVPNSDRAKAARPNLDRVTSARLVGYLEHADGWWRSTAQRLLLERQDTDADDDLRRLIGFSRNPMARMLAARLLDHFGRLTESDAVRLLSDENARVREHGVALAERWLLTSPAIQERLIQLAADADDRIRIQVAFSLGEWDSDRILAPLAAIAAANANDANTRAAVVSAVPARAERLLAILLDRPIEAAIKLLPMMLDLAVVVGARQNESEIAACLRRLDRQTVASETRLQILAALSDSASRRGRSLNAIVKKLAANEPRLADWLDGQWTLAAEAARSPRVDMASREAAIRLLATAPWPLAGPVLVEMLERGELQSQLAAVRALAAQSVDVTAILMNGWRGYSPSVRREVAEAMVRTIDRAVVLLVAIESEVIRSADLDPAIVRRLVGHANATVRERAKKALAAAIPGDRKLAVDQYQAALEVTGDGRRGREVFAKHCATCHAVAGVGVNVGSDISDTRTKSTAQLLNDILNPNAAVDGNFVEYVVTLKNGRQITGVMAGETAAGLTLRRAENKSDTVLRGDVDEVQSTGRSLMPEGLEKAISVAEMADLIAFLKNWRYLDGAVPLGANKN